MPDEPEITPPETDGAPPERQSTPFLVLQFFIFPMSIVAVCVTVFVVFGLIASEGKGARAYVAEVRSGSENRRWQAAFELSNLLQAGKDKALADPQFAEELTKVFEDSRKDDPRVRRYLALALGRLGSRQAVPALVAAARGDGSGPDAPADSETRIYAVWALGVIRDPSVAPELAALAKSDDAGIRKTAVHALGAFASEAATKALREAVEDPAEDVRWNAAVALARRHDAAAVPVLTQMMDRTHLADVDRRLRQAGPEAAGLSPEQKEDAILEAVTAAAALKDPALRPVLEGLRDGDSNLKVREAARRALQGTSP